MRQQLYALILGLALLLLAACGAASGGMASESAPRAAPAEPMAEADRGEATSGFEGAKEENTYAVDGMNLAGMPAPPPPPPSATAAMPAPQPPSGGVQGSPGSGVADKPAVASQVAAVRGPVLIYTAQFTMGVFEVNTSLTQIEELARELGGFLSRRTDNAITIRVPVRTFDGALRRIEKLGDVLNRNVTAQDVTEEFRDIEVRLRNARAVRDRLEQLLAKATKVEESVQVERELERVTGEIERMEGRLKFLADRAAFSTITVTFQPKRQEEISRGPFRLPVPWLYQLGLSRLLNL